MYLEPFPSPAVVVITVDEKVISFFTSRKRRCMNISHVPNKTDKVLNSLTLLAPQIGMDTLLHGISVCDCNMKCSEQPYQ